MIHDTIIILTVTRYYEIMILLKRNEINEMTYSTLEQALKTKLAIIEATSTFEYKGVIRKSLKVRKSNGKKIYEVVQYENGRYSEAF